MVATERPEQVERDGKIADVQTGQQPWLKIMRPSLQGVLHGNTGEYPFRKFIPGF